MAKISYRRHRFPPVIIQHAVSRFTLSYRDAEELLAERINSPRLRRPAVSSLEAYQMPAHRARRTAR
jgi:hypothetical protein